MKNEVKKKMMMQEHEPAVPKSLHENFCKRNIQSSDARSLRTRIFFLTMMVNVEDVFAPESTTMTVGFAWRALRRYAAEASIVCFAHL